MLEKISEKIKKIVPSAKEISVNITHKEIGLNYGTVTFTTDNLDGEFNVGFIIYDINNKNFTLTASEEDIIKNVRLMENKGKKN